MLSTPDRQGGSRGDNLVQLSKNGSARSLRAGQNRTAHSSKQHVLLHTSRLHAASQKQGLQAEITYPVQVAAAQAFVQQHGLSTLQLREAADTTNWNTASAAMDNITKTVDSTTTHVCIVPAACSTLEHSQIKFKCKYVAGDIGGICCCLEPASPGLLQQHACF